MRWLAFACFGLLIGAVGFVLWCWPAGASSPLVLRLTMGAWSGLAGSVLGAVLLQGVYGAGEGVSQVFWPDVLHETLYSRYGRSLGIRLILVIVALFVFTAILGSLRADSRRAPVAASATWGVLALAWRRPGPLPITPGSAARYRYRCFPTRSTSARAPSGWAG